MRQSAILILLCLPNASATLAQPRSLPAAVTAADTTLERPSVVRHRSMGEEIAALPGRIVYLPFHVVLKGSEYAVGAIWERRLLDRVKDWLTTADGRAGIRPLSNTGVGTGARLFYRNVDLTSSWGRSASKRQYHLLRFTFPRNQLPGRSRLAARFRKEPGESFYGIGHESRREDRTRFLQEDVEVRWTYDQRLNPAFRIEATVGYRATLIGEGRYGIEPGILSVYEPSSLAGLGGRAHFGETALTLGANFLDVPGSPTRGNKTSMHLGFAQSLDGDGLSYLSITAVTEQFRELFYRRTLSVRFGTDWRFSTGENGVPYYSLASVGGNLFVRGYQRGRFRDRGSTFATITYKFPVWTLVDAALFYETGRTFHTPKDFTFRDWRGSYGGGLRVWVPEGILFEQNLIHSGEETRLIFSFSTTF